MTFARKLRELRDAKGLSEVKLAEVSGVSSARFIFTVWAAQSLLSKMS